MPLMLMFYQDTQAVESALVSPAWTDRGHHWHEGFKSLIKGGKNTTKMRHCAKYIYAYVQTQALVGAHTL